jgi:hypothetical protein
MSRFRQKDVNILSRDALNAHEYGCQGKTLQGYFRARLAVYGASNNPMIFRQSTRRLIAKTIIAAATIAALAACGDPKYQAPAIVVTFSPALPTSIDTGSTIGVTAIVTNDPQNAGVNLTCVPAGDCGAFNPAQIASNVPSCYQAPVEVPAGNTVTLTATSVTDPTKSVSSTLTVLEGDPVQGCPP